MDYYDTKEFNSEDTWYLTDEEGGLLPESTIRTVPDDIFEDIIIEENDNYVGEPENNNVDEIMEDVQHGLEHLDDLFENMCIEFVKEHENEQKVWMYDPIKETFIDQNGFTEEEWTKYVRIVHEKFIYNVETHQYERRE